MKQYIKDDIYYIENNAGEVVFTVQIDPIINNSIIIRTNKEVYAGPIDFISFSADTGDK